MLGSINPLGEWGRQRSWRITTTFFVIGSTLGGTVLGAALGVLGAPLVSSLHRLSPAAPLGLLAAIAVLGLLLDVHVGGLRVPSIHRQVNQRWMHVYRSWVYGIGFGAQLGVGVVTVVTTTATYATFGACILSGSYLLGACVGGTFGALRGLTLLAARQVRTPEQLDAMSIALERWEPRTRSITYAAQGLLALLATALTTLYAL